MSNQVGQPAGLAHRVSKSKGVLITAGVAVATVGIAYAFAAPFSGVGSAVRASFVSAASPAVSGTPLLSAAGLESLLDARFAPVGAAVTQQGNAAAQQATSLLGNGLGSYSSDGNTLTLDLPAIAGIGGSVQAALSPIGSQMGALSGSDGQVANAVNSSVVSINPLLKLTGPNATLSANVPIDLDAAVAPDLSNTTGAGAVTIDPQAGTVSVDLSKLLSDDGTNVGSGTALSPVVVAEIAADINAAASTLGDNVVSSATNSVEGTPVNVNANLSLQTQPSTTGGSSSCSAPASGAAPDTTTTTTTGGGLLGGLGGTLDNLLNGTIGSTVGGTVDGLLCSLPTNVLPALLTTLSLNLGGNVGQVIEGTAPPATGSISVLGQPTSFNAGAISHGVGSALLRNFAGTTSTNGSTSGSTSGGQGSGSGSNGSGGFGLGLTIGADLGNGSGGLLGGSGSLLGGSGLGGLGLGGLLGSNGSTVTPGILGSLLQGGGVLPIGISASVGSGSTGSGTSSSGSGLLNVNVGAKGSGNGSGLGASVNVGTPAAPSGTGSSTGSSSGSILGVQIGTPATGGTGSGGLLNLGILGH